MESHEAQHWSDVCPVFPQCLHCKSDLLFLPPLPLKFLLPRPLLLQSPLEGSLDWSLSAREAPILDAKECIFTTVITVSVIYKEKQKNNNLADLQSLLRWIQCKLQVSIHKLLQYTKYTSFKYTAAFLVIQYVEAPKANILVCKWYKCTKIKHQTIYPAKSSD